jgi:hypothetical protein
MGQPRPADKDVVPLARQVALSPGLVGVPGTLCPKLISNGAWGFMIFCGSGKGLSQLFDDNGSSAKAMAGIRHRQRTKSKARMGGLLRGMRTHALQ